MNNKIMGIFVVALFIGACYPTITIAQNEFNVDQNIFQLFINEKNNGSNNDSEIVYTWFSNPVRWREVDINPLFFKQNMIAKGNKIFLNLFNDTSYFCEISHISSNILGTKIIRGIIQDDLIGNFCITITGSRVLIDIRVPEKNQLFITQSDSQKGLHYLIELELDLEEELVCEESLLLQYDKKYSTNVNKNDKSNENTIIDVMIIYTPAAKNWANSNGGINNVISQAISKGQITLGNSDTDANINLVHSAEIDYVESGDPNTDLSRLRSTSDGHMDEVHTLRDQYGADLVQLFENNPGTGGIAYLLSNPTGDPASGFSIVRVQQAATGYTSIHEFGHNMGFGHHKGQNFQPGPGLFSYSAGWRWIESSQNRYCTIMTYTSGSYFPDGYTHVRVPYISNPSVYYQGYSTGDPVDGDNARTLREVKDYISDYRNPVQQLSYLPTSHNFGIVLKNQIYQTSFDIWNSGVDTLTWSLSDTDAWLTYNPSSGSSTGETDTINVSIDTTGLSHGSYSGDISISSNGGNEVFTVKFTINPYFSAEAGGPYSGKVGEEINFNGEASDGTPPYTYNWDFGDGTFGSGQNPTHVYNVEDNYLITLSVTDDDFNSADDIGYVYIYGEAFVAYVGGPYSGDVGETITFSGSAFGGTPPYTYHWDFGDGNTDTGQNTTHVYNSEGTYPVILTVTDDTGETVDDTTTATIGIALPDLVCSGSLTWADVTPGDTVTGSFTVSNVGGAGTGLNWEVDTYPSWGNWTFTPDSGIGLTPEGDNVTVQVSVIAPDEEEVTKTGEVKIVNSDDSSDSCTVSISLATPNNYPIFNPLMQLLKMLMQRFPILQQILWLI
jgi:PKD repeat protein